MYGLWRDLLILVLFTILILLVMSLLGCSTTPTCKSYEDPDKWCNPPRRYQPEHRR